MTIERRTFNVEQPGGNSHRLNDGHLDVAFNDAR